MSLISVYVVSRGRVWVVTDVPPSVDRYNVCAGMHSSLDLHNRLNSWHIRPATYLVAFIPSVRTVIIADNIGHCAVRCLT